MMYEGRIKRKFRSRRSVRKAEKGRIRSVRRDESEDEDDDV